MAFNDCVRRGVEGGEIDPARAEALIKEYEDAITELRKSMGETQADITAARQVTEQARIEAAERRRVMQLQAAATGRQIERLRAHTNIRGELDPGQYLKDMIANSRGANGNTLSGRYEAVRRSFRREMTEAITSFRANLAGVRRNKETLANVRREVFGEDTGDALAASIAKSWAGVAERARTRFNAAGGHIGKRSDWGLPQSHDAAKLRRVSYEQWRDDIVQRLDVEAMARDFNDGRAYSPERLDKMLRDSYEAIRTDGYSRREPSVNHGSALRNRRADHRFFKFKSADDWAAYSAKYGSGDDEFRVMMGHLDRMAMDIAMMEELGPNPTHAFRYLGDAARQLAAKSADEGAVARVTRRLKMADNMMDLFTGRGNVPDHRGVARGASALRNFLSSAHLGSAILSSVTDFNTQRIAAGFVGMNKMGFMRQLSSLTTSRAMRNEANDAGLIFENAVDVGNAVGRFEIEEMHVEAAARLADGVIRSSGLGWLTEVQRQSFGLEFMSQAAKVWQREGWDAMNPKTQRMFESYGISSKDWPAIQKAEVHEAANGMRILRAQEIEAVAGSRVADSYMEAITSLTEFAIPSTNVFGRAAILGSTKAGSVSGEMVRFGLQFKSFPVTVMVTQFGRIMSEVMEGRPKNALSYASGLFIGATILGGLAIQLKEISKGKDPRDMSSPKFWAAAMSQGGGLGLFGDFLFSDQNRFGGGVGQTIAGPGVGFIEDMVRFTVGNAQQAVAGDDTQMGKEFVNLMRRYTPGGSLWYLRLAYEREVLDQMQRLVDPNASASFRTRDRRAADYDTDYFMEPGASILQNRGNPRAPDFGNALGE